LCFPFWSWVILCMFVWRVWFTVGAYP
jgi:hypothetical protein